MPSTIITACPFLNDLKHPFEMPSTSFPLYGKVNLPIEFLNIDSISGSLFLRTIKLPQLFKMLVAPSRHKSYEAVKMFEL